MSAFCVTMALACLSLLGLVLLHFGSKNSCQGANAGHSIAGIHVHFETLQIPSNSPSINPYHAYPLQSNPVSHGGHGFSATWRVEGKEHPPEMCSSPHHVDPTCMVQLLHSRNQTSDSMDTWRDRHKNKWVGR